MKTALGFILFFPVIGPYLFLEGINWLIEQPTFLLSKFNNLIKKKIVTPYALKVVTILKLDEKNADQELKDKQELLKSLKRKRGNATLFKNN